MAMSVDTTWEVTRIKPCPFCGEDRSLHVPVIEVYRHWVVCGACDAEGPKRSTSEQAISSWNRISMIAEAANNAKTREAELLLHLHTLKSFALTLMNKYRDIVVARDSRRATSTYDSKQDPILKRGYELIALTDGMETEVEDAG